MEARQVNLNEIVSGRFLSLQISNIRDIFDTSKVSFSKDDSKKMGKIFKKMNLLEETPLAEYVRKVNIEEFGEAISRLLMFIVALNNGNKLPQSKNRNTDFELNQNLDDLDDMQIMSKINQLFQKNAMNKTWFFGILPLGVYMNLFSFHPLTPKLDEAKLETIEENKEALYDIFIKLGLFNSLNQTEEACGEFIKKPDGRTLHLRVLGTNHILLRTQFNALKIFLETHQELKNKNIKIELLGKTGTNNSFGEDDKSEITVMQEMAKEYLPDFPLEKIISVTTKGNFVNTVQTIQTADLLEASKINEGDVVLYFGCASALNRQFLDITNYIQGQKNNNYPSYFTACGGYSALEEDLKIFTESYKDKEVRFQKAAKVFERLKGSNLLTELGKGCYTSFQNKIIAEKEKAKQQETSSSSKTWLLQK